MFCDGVASKSKALVEAPSLWFRSPSSCSCLSGVVIYCWGLIFALTTFMGRFSTDLVSSCYPLIALCLMTIGCCFFGLLPTNCFVFTTCLPLEAELLLEVNCASSGRWFCTPG